MNGLRKNASAPAAVQSIANALTKKWSKLLASSAPLFVVGFFFFFGFFGGNSACSGPARALALNGLGSFCHRLRPACFAAASTPVLIRPDPEFNPAVALKSAIGDKPRDKTVELFVNAFSIGIQNADQKLLLWKARQIEEAMFKEYNGFSEKYKSQFRTLLSNLKNVDNLKLRTEILGGDIAAKSVATFTSQDLMSESAKFAAKKAEAEFNHWASTAKSTEAVTDEFKCGKCGQRKCTYYQKQTRSADEPMTTFVTCQNCGNKWKFC
ncbi:transcription elongation factor [Rhizoclosmatium globosum]|uniref:Transcription elongation factor n=1 Tax=Rhizoclosmatium globosum TaxID=329046 RepID=A0A1Y2CPX3_9FUNG|nr:transcription elongation factor [Rhizoclosmatium globosum]|eukprot:ORY49033.1 transcription elongation factor [Rhizoclosmatium globosum]